MTGGRLARKAAIVTGGASGFGRGIVEALAGEGARVLVADLNLEGARATAEQVEQLGGTAAAVRVDVTRRNEVGRMVAACCERFDAVDILVANAGIGQRPTPLEEIPEEVFDRQFAVNVKGVAYCCQEVIPRFRRQGAGNIVVTASGIALMPRPNLIAYGAAKAAVLALTKGLALELAPEGFRVNALCPAVGNTPMLAEFSGEQDPETARASFADALPLGRLITPEDVGRAAVFLASDTEAASITGCALPVDAGRCI